ncbi:TPA: hypothetical protein PXN94_000521 [Yersinia enterocolitica]|nr:hypothetical protein [Yersinia enterocolitica]HDL7533895.1 hypothetical protein [Yersinia enterocolitica]
MKKVDAMQHDAELMKEIYAIKQVITLMISLLTDEQKDALVRLSSSLKVDETLGPSDEVRDHVQDINSRSHDLVMAGTKKFD